jgi:hypothetical protein
MPWGCGSIQCWAAVWGILLVLFCRNYGERTGCCKPLKTAKVHSQIILRTKAQRHEEVIPVGSAFSLCLCAFVRTEFFPYQQ